MKTLLIATSLAILLTGCATDQRSGTYQSDMGQQPMRVKTGVVVDVRIVDMKTKPSGIGAASGAAIGGIAANSTGSGAKGAVAGVAGAVIGGVLGNMAEGAYTDKKGIEVLYTLDGSKEVYALVQQLDEANPLTKGDRIRLIESYSSTRIIRLTP